uniref:Protein muscleblind n=1 Tax=Cacopsylla melanoneura TaxID=428564 RepID=A0A8D8U8L3_9HEMI
MFQGRCNREKPPCKYFHPPQHLKDQLLINGRNHLALKNALLQQMGLTPPGQPMLPGQMPTVSKMSSFSPSTTQAQLSVFTSQQSQLNLMATTPYLAAGMTQVGNTFSPYFSPAGPLMPTMMTQDPNNSLALVQQNAVAQQKIARTDRIERPHSTPVPVTTVENAGIKIITCSERLSDCQTCMAQLQGAHQSQGQGPPAFSTQPYIVDSLLQMDMKGVGSFYYDNFSFPGMMPFKRPAGDKSGVPVYQPNAAAYQQLLQPFVPVSFTGHPPGIPRF